jgi:hypothetical protein
MSTALPDAHCLYACRCSGYPIVTRSCSGWCHQHAGTTLHTVADWWGGEPCWPCQRSTVSASAGTVQSLVYPTCVYTRYISLRSSSGSSRGGVCSGSSICIHAFSCSGAGAAGQQHAWELYHSSGWWHLRCRIGKGGSTHGFSQQAAGVPSACLLTCHPPWAGTSPTHSKHTQHPRGCCCRPHSGSYRGPQGPWSTPTPTTSSSSSSSSSSKEQGW